MKFVMLLLAILISMTSFAHEGYEEIKFDLLEVTVPAHMDDHGKFGIATPDFELSFQVVCSIANFESNVYLRKSFTLPANKTDKAITHQIKNVSLKLDPEHLEICSRRDLITISLEEREFFGTDDYATKSIKNLLFGRDSAFLPNSSYEFTFGEKDLGEARWSVLGMGSYGKFKVKARMTSHLFK